MSSEQPFTADDVTFTFDLIYDPKIPTATRDILTFAGKPLIVSPSTAPQVALDLDAIDPQHPDGRALIIADAPGYSLHYWDGQTLLTHFEIAGPRNVLASYNSNLQPMMRAFLTERGTG